MQPALRQTVMTWLALLALACQIVVSAVHGPHSHSGAVSASTTGIYALADNPSVPGDPGGSDHNCELCAMLAAIGLFVLTLAAILILPFRFDSANGQQLTALVRPEGLPGRARARAPPAPTAA